MQIKIIGAGLAGCEAALWLAGISQRVMYLGKEISRNTRPTSAGLKTFCPSPPKDIFATPIATTAPMKTTHHGVVEGRFSASNIPVTAAEKSPMVEGFFSRYLVMRYSINMQDKTLTARTSSSPRP